MNKLSIFGVLEKRDNPVEIRIALRTEGPHIRVVRVDEQGRSLGILLTFYINGTIGRHALGGTLISSGFVLDARNRISDDYDKGR